VKYRIYYSRARRRVGESSSRASEHRRAIEIMSSDKEQARHATDILSAAVSRANKHAKPLNGHEWNDYLDRIAIG
jgi:hypothetical protein